MSTIHAKPTAAKQYGPRLPVGEARACRVCTRAIDPADRAHVCRACRLRKCRGATVGEACEACSFDDKRMLCRRELAHGPATLCGNCATLAGRRRVALADLRAELAA